MPWNILDNNFIINSENFTRLLYSVQNHTHVLFDPQVESTANYLQENVLISRMGLVLDDVKDSVYKVRRARGKLVE